MNAVQVDYINANTIKYSGKNILLAGIAGYPRLVHLAHWRRYVLIGWNTAQLSARRFSRPPV